ncbi:MAG: ATP-binding cassette domain-containing protein [Actinomycetota bacterium]
MRTEPGEHASGLRVEGLQKAFETVVALRDVSFHVERGQLLGFLGPNGAGKTTSMRAILGLTVLDDGTVTWDGQPVTDDLRSKIGYMPQERGLYPRMRVQEHVAYIGRLAGLSRAEADARAAYWIGRVGLTDRRDDDIQSLSTGNQQRVQLCVALVHDPELLVLDEPFAGLDPVVVKSLSSLMQELVADGKAVLFSSHQLELVEELARDVTIVAAGQTLASGTVASLRAAADHRILRVAWDESVTGAWQPPVGTVVSHTDGVTEVHVDRDVDPGGLIEAAAGFGRIASVTFDPPALEDVFLGLVGRDLAVSE